MIGSARLLLFAAVSIIYAKRPVGDPIAKLALASNNLVSGAIWNLT